MEPGTVLETFEIGYKLLNGTDKKIPLRVIYEKRQCHHLYKGNSIANNTDYGNLRDEPQGPITNFNDEKFKQNFNHEYYQGNGIDIIKYIPK